MGDPEVPRINGVVVRLPIFNPERRETDDCLGAEDYDKSCHETDDYRRTKTGI